MHEGLKKRIEQLETATIPIVTPEGQEIIDLLHQYEEFIEHPERLPIEDPVETRAMLQEFLSSDEAQALQARKMEARNRT